MLMSICTMLSEKQDMPASISRTQISLSGLGKVVRENPLTSCSNTSDFSVVTWERENAREGKRELFCLPALLLQLSPAKVSAQHTLKLHHQTLMEASEASEFGCDVPIKYLHGACVGCRVQDPALHISFISTSV